MAAKITAMSMHMCISRCFRVTPCSSLSRTLHSCHKNVKYKRACACIDWTVPFSQGRHHSHHPTPLAFPYPDIPNHEAAKSFAIHLDRTGRSLLLDELSKLKTQEEESNNVSSVAVERIPRSQLLSVYMFHGIPFIGFGILDNMIMIIAGEYIDVTLGAMLGISTMAAAALGNLISDLAGVGTAGYVELLASKVGVKPPNITPEQALTKQVRWAVGWGRSIGIAVGCLIGMFPLLFFESKEESNDKDSPTENKQVQTDTAASTSS